MKILALEFSSPERSVAVALDGRVAGQAVESGSRDSHPLRLVEAALAEAGLAREELEVLAVGLGPGSYFGVRSAIALAQGWQLARPVRVCGVSSADAIALEAQRRSLLGPIRVVIDAHRGELYVAGYEVSAEACRPTEPLRLVSRGEASRVVEGCPCVVGPEAVPGGPVAHRVVPSAVALVRLVPDSARFIAAVGLEPLYLRAAHFVKAPPPRVLPDL